MQHNCNLVPPAAANLSAPALDAIFGPPHFSGMVPADYRRGLDRAIEVHHLASHHSPSEALRHYWEGLRDGLLFALSISREEFYAAVAAQRSPSTADLAGVDVDAERV